MASSSYNLSPVSPELDDMVCDLIGYMLDELAEGRNPGVAVCAEDGEGGRIEAVFTDDGEEACLEAARDLIVKNKRGNAAEHVSALDRYAYACTGGVNLEDGYHDAVLVSFFERALPCGYSAYVLFENPGGGDAFGWAEPEPAGEEPALI